MRTVAIPDYRSTPGNKGAYALRRMEGDTAHFLMVTFWESEEAIRAFAGDDISVAKYYDFDKDFLRELGPCTVTDVHFHSSSIEGMFWCRIIGPQVGPNERLPVLYLLHGVNSDLKEITEHSEVTNLAAASHLIIVMPEVGFSYYTNAKHKRHARWENAVAEELPRDVEKRFPVLSGREHTGIAGISMGGYGAVKLALKHPALYGFVGNMSGPLDITRREASLRRWGQTLRIWNTFGVRPNIRRDEDVFDLLDRAVEVKSVTWFESCGKNDALLSVNERFARKLRERGVTLDLITTSGGHDWQSWNAAMPDLFRIAEKSLR